jgi:hypothetical protein
MNLNISFQVLENIELNEKSFNGHLLQVLKFWRKREGDKAKVSVLIEMQMWEEQPGKL